MALSIQLGYPDVPKSVTNPSVNINDALDVSSPLPFLKFIKLINVSYEPDSLLNYYNFYLTTWNSLDISKDINADNLIVNKYKDFLKELSLNYTTLEEKKFLSSMDVNDPYDLDIAIGIYSKKLKELSSFYNKKRQDVKFDLIRNKLKGTNFGAEKSIIELTLSYLKNLEDNVILYNYDDIKDKIEVEIEEIYDGYPLYFNQIPDSQIYDNKDLDYGLDIFLKTNPTIISESFSDISEELKTLKEVDQLLDNKRLLTEKYLYTDYYYLSTGSTVTNFISGKILTSESPIFNFLNRNYPTTASTQQTTFETIRERGFFRPQNVSIVVVDGLTTSFSFNFENLKPNSIYYFPNPNLIGENGNLMTFIVDDSFLKRNFSSGNASNQPTSSQYDTKYFGYVSKIDPNEYKALSLIFDRGYVKDLKQDIFGNTYGLLKNDGLFTKHIESLEITTIVSMLFNGHNFYDHLYDEGYNFNYSTFDDSTFSETLRTGLSSYTNSFISPPSNLVISFGTFKNFNELAPFTESNLVTNYEILEGAYITTEANELYPDPISSDLYSFELSDDPFYYTDLIEGGISDDSPLTRALFSDPTYPSLTANATITYMGDDTDGGDIDAPFNLDLTGLNSPFYNIVYTPTVLAPTPQFGNNGVLYIKTPNNTIHSLSSGLEYISTKYPYYVLSDLVNILNFEIYIDVIVIETENYIIFDKLKFENEEFIDPETTVIIIDKSTDPYSTVTNRIRVGNDIFFVKLISYGLSGNDFKLIPYIYKFDYINVKNELLFPKNNDQFTEFFNVSGENIRYVECPSSHLTYDSKSNIFNISFLLKDQNDMFDLQYYNFYLNPDVEFMSHSVNRVDLDNHSNIFDDTLTVHTFLSSSSIITQEELII